MAECAVEKNVESLQGTFWSIFMLHMLIGNVIAYVILQQKEYFGIFFIVMTLISLSSVFVFARTSSSRRDG